MYRPLKSNTYAVFNLADYSSSSPRSVLRYDDNSHESRDSQKKEQKGEKGQLDSRGDYVCKIAKRSVISRVHWSTLKNKTDNTVEMVPLTIILLLM